MCNCLVLLHNNSDGCNSVFNYIDKVAVRQATSSTEFKSEFNSYCSFSHQNCPDSHHRGHTSMMQIYSDHCHI